MLIDSISIEILVAFTSGLGVLLVFACADRYLVRRRASAFNAAYLAMIDADRINYLHPIDRSYDSARFVANSGFIEMVRKEQIQLEAPGFFSRRTVLSDAGGCVVAARYEEFVMADFAKHAMRLERPLLMLGH